MVIVLLAKDALTPLGKLIGVPIPVAPDVACVIFVMAELMQTVGLEEAAPAVFKFTVIVPVAFKFPQPPVKGIE
jgi:hypothetical protein